ncbi:Phosphoglycerate mutase [Ectocarpus siliculosus]|uniref:Phosphoglycerate mutase n=1 Tax=Ectocarpus siliculosus TaxID=2880 RepID=D8LF56_ECTSI|nr:Phosphoglycerate mutase [Ectocarpus siliculosus]|eukprot:CBN78654.1 Phosphoglycerate mutase [Ectocarpus siliculosus]
MPRLLCTLHFVRHGETTANREGIIQGHQDYDLTPIGINQAVATAIRLRGNTYWQTYSSDLTRASHTAEIILEEHAGANLRKTPLLREFALGAQEGLPRGTTWPRARRMKAEAAGVSPVAYNESLRESPADVHKRAQQFLASLVSDAVRAADDGTVNRVGQGRNGRHDSAAEAAAAAEARNGDENARLALVVSHGGILNVMMLTVMGLDEKACPLMRNCAVAVVDVVDDGRGKGRVRYVPRTLNDVSHFQSIRRQCTASADKMMSLR